MLNIISANGRWRATVEEDDDGIVVEIFAITGMGKGKLMARERYDASPFHVVLDRAQAAIDQAHPVPGVHTLPTRRHVKSII